MSERRKKPRKKSPPAAIAPKPVPAEQRAKVTGAVTLWGEILDEDATHLKMAVLNHGGAEDVGVCGEVWIKKLQIFGKPGRADGYDYVRIGFAYASLLAQSCQKCE
jgi:hypothetical protein